MRGEQVLGELFLLKSALKGLKWLNKKSYFPSHRNTQNGPLSYNNFLYLILSETQ